MAMPKEEFKLEEHNPELTFVTDRLDWELFLAIYKYLVFGQRETVKFPTEVGEELRISSGDQGIGAITVVCTGENTYTLTCPVDVRK